MKMVIAIIHDEDAHSVVEELNSKEFSVTKLASTGGFLKSGNTTLLIGVQKEKVGEVTDIIKNICKSRKEITTASTVMGDSGSFVSMPLEVIVGGATVFVLDVDQYYKF